MVSHVSHRPGTSLIGLIALVVYLLTDGLKRHKVKTLGGLLTRLAAKVAA